MTSNDITRGQWIEIGKVSRSINMSLFWSPMLMSYHTLYVMLQKINTKCTLIKLLIHDIQVKYFTITLIMPVTQLVSNHCPKHCWFIIEYRWYPAKRALSAMRISCQKGPICHAYAWQIGPFWQDALAIRTHQMIYIGISSIIPILQLKYVHWLNGPWEMW